MAAVKVVAVRQGFYKRLINEGELFEIDEPKHFSERWMKKFDAKTKPAKEADPVPVRRKNSPVTAIEKPKEDQTPKTLKDLNPATDNWSS